MIGPYPLFSAYFLPSNERFLTVFRMHFLDDPRVLALLDRLMVELIPHRSDCQFPAGEPGKRAEIEPIDNQPYCPCDRHSERDI